MNILIILIILGGGGAATYYYNQSVNYVKTDNAHVDGRLVTISATAAGRLTDWTGQVGKAYASGDRVGSIATAAAAGGAAGTAAGRVDIDFPVGATIVQQNVVPNGYVSPGAVLARAYDLNNLWITANIDENVINNVKSGQAVDVYVDAYPGTVLSGHVDKLGLTTAGTFSLLPASNTTANYTKVSQVIPVTILLDGYKGLTLAPGMSTTVRIHI
ncbi:efflux RND transporter periplasmic adaptor subunit [Paenibacillus sp. P25]|nr:efflux RND transporter periplasmic adaptor subunit [Paenibacillus sp. P25]